MNLYQIAQGTEVGKKDLHCCETHKLLSFQYTRLPSECNINRTESVCMRFKIHQDWESVARLENKSLYALWGILPEKNIHILHDS